MIKRGLSLFLAVMLLFSLSGCSEIAASAVFLFFAATDANDDRADKDAIFQFVCDNEDELRQAIEVGDFSAFENKGIVKNINADHEAVDFSCGGAGMGSATAYVGFYYTPDHDITAAWCAPPSASTMTRVGNGYEWREPNGDNRYYTEQICENFFYYEASF